MKKTPLQEFLKYSGLGIQMVAVIGLFIAIGYGLDKWLKPSKPWFTIIFSLLGCAYSIYFIIRQFGTPPKK